MAESAGGSEFPYLPDEEVGDLCCITDIDPAIPVEISGKVCRLLPDDHIGYLRDIADVDGTIAVEVTPDRYSDVSWPGDRGRGICGGDREVHSVGARGGIDMNRILFRIKIGLIPAILMVGYSPSTGDTGKYRYP